MRTPLCASPHGAPGCRCPFVLTPLSKARVLPTPQPEEGAGPGATSTLTSSSPSGPLEALQEARAVGSKQTEGRVHP